MIYEVRYKEQIINQKDIQVIWSDHYGEKLTGNIEDYGASKYNDAWEECEAGEGW